MKARATVRVTDMDAFADALCSGEFPSEGLTDFIEISSDGTVKFRGQAWAVANVISYLADLGVLSPPDGPIIDDPIPEHVMEAAKALMLRNAPKVSPGWQ